MADEKRRETGEGRPHRPMKAPRTRGDGMENLERDPTTDRSNRDQDSALLEQKVAEPRRSRRQESVEGFTDGVRRMQLDATAHTARPWRIHELLEDFDLADVWTLPTPGGPGDLARLARPATSLSCRTPLSACCSRALRRAAPEDRREGHRHLRGRGEGRLLQRPRRQHPLYRPEAALVIGPRSARKVRPQGVGWAGGSSTASPDPVPIVGVRMGMNEVRNGVGKG